MGDRFTTVSGSRLAPPMYTRPNWYSSSTISTSGTMPSAMTGSLMVLPPRAEMLSTVSMMPGTLVSSTTSTSVMLPAATRPRAGMMVMPDTEGVSTVNIVSELPTLRIVNICEWQSPMLTLLKFRDFSRTLIFPSGSRASRWIFLLGPEAPMTRRSSSPTFPVAMGFQATIASTDDLPGTTPWEGVTVNALEGGSQENSAGWLLGFDRTRLSWTVSPVLSTVNSKCNSSTLTLRLTGTTSALTSMSNMCLSLIT